MPVVILDEVVVGCPKTCCRLPGRLVYNMLQIPFNGSNCTSIKQVEWCRDVLSRVDWSALSVTRSGWYRDWQAPNTVICCVMSLIFPPRYIYHCM